MPIYEYECSECSNRFELKQSFHDKPEAVCPKCKKTAKRVFHPAPIIFKGSGFYVTDHRPAAKDTGTDSGKEKSEAGKSTK
jgi:putative FmdB family regulatory protein